MSYSYSDDRLSSLLSLDGHTRGGSLPIIIDTKNFATLIPCYNLTLPLTLKLRGKLWYHVPCAMCNVHPWCRLPVIRKALRQFLESPLKTFAIYFIVVDEIGGWNNNPDIYANRVSRTNLRLVTHIIELVLEVQGWTTPYNNRLELYKNHCVTRDCAYKKYGLIVL